MPVLACIIAAIAASLAAAPRRLRPTIRTTRFACESTQSMANTSSVVMPRWLSVPRRLRVAEACASQIRTTECRLGKPTDLLPRPTNLACHLSQSACWINSAQMINEAGPQAAWRHAMHWFATIRALSPSPRSRKP